MVYLNIAFSRYGSYTIHASIIIIIIIILLRKSAKVFQAHKLLM